MDYDFLERLIEESEYSGKDISELASEYGSTYPRKRFKAYLDIAKEIICVELGADNTFVHSAIEYYVKGLKEEHGISVEFPDEPVFDQIDMAIRREMVRVGKLPYEQKNFIIDKACKDYLMPYLTKRLVKVKDSDNYVMRYDLLQKDLGVEFKIIPDKTYYSEDGAPLQESMHRQVKYKRGQSAKQLLKYDDQYGGYYFFCSAGKVWFNFDEAEEYSKLGIKIQSLIDNHRKKWDTKKDMTELCIDIIISDRPAFPEVYAAEEILKELRTLTTGDKI